jgi:hypothetical protein
MTLKMGFSTLQVMKNYYVFRWKHKFLESMYFIIKLTTFLT